MAHIREANVAGTRNLPKEDIRTRTVGNTRTESKGAGSGGSFVERMMQQSKQKKISDDVGSVDASYIQSFLDDADKYFTSAATEASGLQWGQGKIAYTNRQKAAEQLDHRRNVLYSWLTQNKSRMDADTFAQFEDMLRNYDYGMNNTLDTFKTLSKIHEDYSSADHYTAVQNGFVGEWHEIPESVRNNPLGTMTRQVYEDATGQKPLLGGGQAVVKTENGFEFTVELPNMYDPKRQEMLQDEAFAKKYKDFTIEQATEARDNRSAALKDQGAGRIERKNDPEVQWLNQYIQNTKAQEAYDLINSMDKNDREALRQEIEQLKAVQTRFWELINMQNNPYAYDQETLNAVAQELRELIQPYGSIRQLEKTLSQKESLLTTNARQKELAAMEQAVEKASLYHQGDFQKAIAYDPAKAEFKGGWKAATDQIVVKGHTDPIYDYINADQEGREQIIKDARKTYGVTLEKAKYKDLDYMNAKEKATYNYYYATEGREAADRYLDLIRETLTYRRMKVYHARKLEDKPFKEFMLSNLTGLVNNFTGIVNAFNFTDDYIHRNGMQILHGMINEDLGNGTDKRSTAQFLYDANFTIANMAPSIALGFIPVAGPYLAAAAMGVSAAGNAYQEILNAGYSKGQARAYSTLIGVSEATLQYFLGGITKIGGTASKGLTSAILGHVDKAFLRVAIQLGASMVSEGIEEGLQTVLENWFKKLVLNLDEDLDWGEVMYSSLMGMITALLMEGGDVASENVGYYKTGKELESAKVNRDALVKLGKTFSPETVAYQLAGRVNEKTGAYTLGRLFHEAGASMTEQNVTELMEILQENNPMLDEKSARKLAEAMQLSINDPQSMSKKMQQLLEANVELAFETMAAFSAPGTNAATRMETYSNIQQALDAATPKAAAATQEEAPVEQAVEPKNAPAPDMAAPAAEGTSPAAPATGASTGGVGTATGTEALSPMQEQIVNNWGGMPTESQTPTKNTAPDTEAAEASVADDGVQEGTEPYHPSAQEQVEQAMGASRYVRKEAGVKVDQKTFDRVERLAKTLRRRVVLVDQPGQGRFIKQGWFDHRSGTLYVNVHSSKAVAWIIGHELTHALESTEAYATLHRMVIRNLKNRGVNLDQMRKDIRGMYAEENVPLQNEAAVDKEIVANYIADNLFTNEREIRRLVNEDAGLGRKILDWINRTLARLGSGRAQERVFLQDAAFYYKKALAQAEQRQVSRETQEGRSQAQADLESGRMTQEEYDEYLDSLDQDEEQVYGFLQDHLDDERRSEAEEAEVQYAVGRNPGKNKGKKKQKTFADNQNANGVFVANILIDMAEDDGFGWTGTYNYVMLSMDLNDDTEFRNLYNEIRKRTVNMEDGAEPTESSFVVKDGEGKEYIYVVELDGFMHGVILEKIDKAKYIAAHKRLIVGGNYGQSNQNIARRTRSERANYGRNHSGNGRTAGSRNAGYGGVDNQSSNADMARNDEGKGSFDQEVSAVTDGEKQFSIGENPDYWEATSEERWKELDGADKATFDEAYEDRQMERHTDPETAVERELTEEERAEFERMRRVAEGETDPAEQKPWEKIVRENLPTKAREYIAGKERKLVSAITQVLGADRFSDRTYLKEAVQSLSNEFLETGTFSQESLDSVFEEAYKQGIVVDAEFYNNYKHIKTHLAKTAVTLNKRDRSSIADYDTFRKDANRHHILRIAEEGGMPVDSAYQELRGMAPELFPESITHPADQLQHMYDVANSIFVMEKNLNGYYGPDAEEFKVWAKNDFQKAVWDIAPELRQAKRYMDDRAAQAEKEPAPTTEAEAMEAYKQLKGARRNYERIMSKNLLTQEDEMLVGRLLRGEILPEHLDPEAVGTKNVIAVFEVKQEYERLAKILGEYKKNVRKKLNELADRYLDTALDWKDKANGLLYQRETMRRNIFDIVPDPELANEICEEFFEPVHAAEANATRFKTDFRNRVRDLGLSTKVEKGNEVSEAHAVQLLGEAMDNIRVIELSKGRRKTRDGKTADEWRSVIADMWEYNPKLDKGKIQGAVLEFRKIYDELFQRMNEVRVRFGYEPVNYRKGYFPHFQPGDGDGLMAQFGRLIGIDTSVVALPTTINGITHTFKPGIQWFGNAQERLGFNTVFDAVEGFDKYIEGVSSVIFHTENIQKLRALANQIRYRTSDQGIQKQVDKVMEATHLNEEEKLARIAQIYESGKFTLSRFVVELEEYTNLLANKKSKRDRAMEDMLGRKAYQVLKNWESKVGANMIAGNISSAITNFIPLVQAGGQIDTKYLLRGMWNTLQAIRKNDGIADASDFLTNRSGSDPIVRTAMQTAAYYAGKPMELIDTFVSGSIVRAAYYQNLARGMSDSEAMHQADITAAGIIADRSKGSTPTLFSATNPVAKLFTQFQLEVNNQFSEMFKDLPRAQKNGKIKSLTFALLKYFLGAWMFNELFEKLFGRRPALDPIGILNEAVGDLTGFEIPNIFGLVGDAIRGEEDLFRTEKKGLGEAGKNLSQNVLGNLPFSSGLSLFGIETDGGRFPISSAIPNVGKMWQSVTEDGWAGKKRLKVFGDELAKPATYLLPPFGGNQISKAWKGVKAWIQGGSYSITSDGEKVLQYPVHKDTTAEAFWNLVRAAIMGKSSLPTAQEWVDSGFDSLSAKETAMYQDMIDAGEKGREAFALIQQLGSLKPVDGNKSVKNWQKIDVIQNADVSGDSKAILYYGTIASEKDRGIMDALADSGADAGTVAAALMDINNADNMLKGAERSNKIREIISNAQLTDDEKILLYHEKVSDSRDDDIQAFAGVGLDFDVFLKAHSEYTQIAEEYSGAGRKATEFSRWVNSLDVTDSQASVIKDCFKFYSQIPASASRYEGFVAAGLGDELAYSLTMDIDALKPMAGEDQVKSIQRWRAVVDGANGEADQLAALAIVMTPAQYDRVKIASDYQISPAYYVTLQETLPSYDANGNGSFTNAEVKAAIDGLCSSGKVTLDNNQKAVLWQLATGTSSAKNNPYSSTIGWKVLEAKQTASSENDEDKLPGSIEEEILRQWGEQ